MVEHSTAAFVGHREVPGSNPGAPFSFFTSIVFFFHCSIRKCSLVAIVKSAITPHGTVGARRSGRSSQMSRDPPLTMQKAQCPCCDSESFDVSDGLFFCSQCGTQSQVSESAIAI